MCMLLGPIHVFALAVRIPFTTNFKLSGIKVNGFEKSGRTRTDALVSVFSEQLMHIYIMI